tara:strand:+ start:17499 stop:18290 length:792 start_codon:yes stop_codon:yes gene_type:complete
VSKFNKKSLGQNFLIDKNIIIKIINLTKIKSKNIIEIGPGKGALTEEIIEQKPKTFIAIEKDNFLSNELKFKYLNSKIVKILNKDFLKLDFEKFSTKKSIIIGNLPYNISSQILVKILRSKKWPSFISDIIFMFQKELGEKILGKFSSKNYGRISILTNYRLQAVNKFYVSPNCFFPKPKVESIVIHFKPKKKINYLIKDLKNLEKVTNILFSNKRKMINKNIKKLLSKDKIKLIKNLNLQSRPSEIRPEIFYKIAELYETKG